MKTQKQMGGLLPLAGVVSVTLPPEGGKTYGRKKTALTGRFDRCFRCFQHLWKSIGRCGGGCQEILIDVVNQSMVQVYPQQSFGNSDCCGYNYPMQYEWDDDKLALNLANHKIHFVAAGQFDWPTAVIEPDRRKDYGEPRFLAYGLVEGRLHCLVFTRRGNRIRIISLRKANPRGVKRYVLEN